MKTEATASNIFKEAEKYDLDLVIVLGISNNENTVMIHNAISDLEASAVIKSFLITLETSILEELYARTKRSLN